MFARVGLTDIAVEYDSPAARGREVWGRLVSYGRPWRSSESPAARVTLGKDISFGGVVVEPGTYALILIPGPESWTVALNRDVAYAAGGGVYLPAHDVARLSVPVTTAPPRERLAFFFSDATHDGVTLDLDWAGVHLAIPLALHTAEQLRVGLEGLEALPSSYAEAARYMLEVRHDYEAGLKYIDNSLALKRDWQSLLIKSALLAAKGDRREARAIDAQAYELRRKMGDDTLPGPNLGKLSSPLVLASTSRDRSKATSAFAEDGLTRDGIARSAIIRQTRTPVVVLHEGIPGDATSSMADDLNERSVTLAVPREPRNLNPLGPDEISAILARGKRDLQSCYQQALRKDPAFTRARVTTSVTIGLSGRARTIVLESPTGLGALEPCLKEIIGRWSFPSAGAEYDVQFPLVLRGHN